MYERRKFLQAMMGLTAGLVLGPTPTARAQEADGTAAEPDAPPTEDRFGELLPQRKLGRTGEWITALGVGGSHALMVSEKEAERIIDTAIEEGARFFDTAVQYGNGNAEARYGRLLTPKYRDVIYLMTKTESTDAAGARRDMDECRQRMKVDVIDLMQIHHIENPEDVDNRVDSGVVDVLLEAREQGKIRHLGFTGHSSPQAHLHMLKRLDGMGVAFDTVQMPFNVFDPSYESFIVQVLPELVEREYGVLAMKTLAFGQLVGQGLGWGGNYNRRPAAVVPEQMSIAEALGFVWSLPVASIVSGMMSVEEVRENTATARAFEPLDEAARARLVELAEPFGGARAEFYKRPA